MPVACSTSALTGADGSLFYTPAGTKWCLLAADFDQVGQTVNVDSRHDFRVGDPVKFTEEKGATIDSGLDTTTSYVVTGIAGEKLTITEADGTAVTLVGDGADNGGHIRIFYDPFGGVCQIQSWDLTIERESLDVTTLPCGVGTGSATSGKYAAFRKTQPGYASGTGTITVIFTSNDDALGQRMLDNVMLSSQEGARVRLFLDTRADGTTGQPDFVNSMYIEASISLESMSVSVNPDDPVTAEIGYTISDVSHLFKTPIAA